MEEKKAMKVVSQKEPSGKSESGKLTYEQLENAAHQLSEQSRNLYMQNQQLMKKLQEADLTNLFKRLDWLWTVINSNTSYITEEFKKNCGEEFMKLMASTEEEQDTEESKE